MNNKRQDIPRDEAFQLCAEIRQKYQGKWWTFTGMQCMGCTAATKGDMTKRCVSNKPGYRGYNLVNDRYDGQIKRAS